MASFIASVKNTLSPQPPPQQQQQQPQQQQQQRPPQQNPHAYPPVLAVPMGVQAVPQWTTRMGDCDPPASCEHWLWACFCTQCAQAMAKSNADGTHGCYNFLCWHHIGSMSYLRREYNLTGTCGDDLMCGLFCTCCLVRRGLTESEVRGRKPSPFVAPGALANRQWKNTLFGCDCCELFEAMLCAPCVAHYTRNILQPYEQGDCCFDMLCVNPMAMYGQVRHHHGIQAEFGIFEDLCLPVVCLPCTLIQARKETYMYYMSTQQRYGQQQHQQGQAQNGRGSCCCC